MLPHERTTVTRNESLQLVRSNQTRLAVLLLALLRGAATLNADMRIGIIDPSSPAAPGPRNAAALEFARTQGKIVRLAPKSGWKAGKRHYAPEEFDLLWFHEADNPGTALPDDAMADLLEYVEGGGSLLLSGAAGRFVHLLGIEPTSPRVIGPAPDAATSGLVVREKHRRHPVFAGLDVSKPILVTSFGGNALADFYGTDGPHGELLADGSYGAGERPLVEYSVGAGRVLFVGWRLPDFSTSKDAHRPNLERLFTNMLHYLAEKNTNRARLIAPPGPARYRRILGVPFLSAAAPVSLEATAQPNERTALIATLAPQDGSLAAGDVHVRELDTSSSPVKVQAIALTLTPRERPASRYLAAQREADARERERIKALKVVAPKVRLLPAPLRPTKTPELEQSVLLGRSHFMAPGDGRGDTEPVYEPVEDGGFRITNSRRQFNRVIVGGQNRVWTGDAPVFRLDAGTGNSSYAADRIYPLWPRQDSQAGTAMPGMGTLRLGVIGSDGKTRWLDEAAGITAIFRPGYTRYEWTSPELGGAGSIVVAPTANGHGMICRVAFERDARLVWQYGGLWWLPQEANANRVTIDGSAARCTEANLPNGLVLAGCDAACEGRVIPQPYGQQAEFAAGRPQKAYHVVVAWGVTKHDEELAARTAARLDTPNASAWTAVRDRLKARWLDCFVHAALDPERRFQETVRAPADALRKMCEGWDKRREAFQVRTPDPYLNALINFERCRSEYHRKGPGLYLGETWQMYSHISTGWYGKEWGGDHEAIDDCLRLYGAMQEDDGFIRWVSPSLMPFHAENNTPYWVDQVWWHYAWTGDKTFVRDLWPAVRKAVAWQLRYNDPDGDGLSQDWYEYWNCDSNGKGPKSAASSAMTWAMLDRAARLAAALGEPAAEAEYRAAADKTRDAIMRELWRENAGRLGCIGADGIWRGHPQIWEEYLAVNAGLLSPEQGRRAMRWLASHYGYEPKAGVRLLSCSDWWPIRWSTQWTPTGDTCLAALAGMKCGDVELWWPYLKTAIGSAFRSEFPGINMGISNTGAGGGDREDVDSVDPYVHAMVRGLFGIEPAIHEGRIDIVPSFPADWREAAIHTPDVSYEYRRDGDRATFRIRTPRRLVKRVRANLSGREAVTPAETESVVTVEIRPAIAPPGPPTHPPTILADQQPPSPDERGRPLGGKDRGRLVLFDLGGACNVTLEEMVMTKVRYDVPAGPPPTLKDDIGAIGWWWGNPLLTMPPSPRVLTADTGVPFLTAGRPRPGVGTVPKNMLALSSWPPYSLPGGAVVPVGIRCERFWLLLQSYVHPMKNYIVNGEVILRYADGREHVESLVPPFNLDAYFQHFARRGVPVPLGRISVPAGGSFVPGNLMHAHADALEIPCDAAAAIESVELRATCSEGLIGLVGMTVLATGTAGD